MKISRIVIRGFRNFKLLDAPLNERVTCVVGENNTGKSNLVFALRLVLDASLSSTYRMLSPEDFCSGTDISTPQQIIISVEFEDFESDDNQQSMLHNCVIGNDKARLTYRFRPKPDILKKIAENDHPGTGLSIDDYRYEIRGAGQTDPSVTDVSEEFGKWVSFEELQQGYLVVLMEPLRDVEQRLRQFRLSPLAKLLTSADIPPEEQDALVGHLKTANDEISKSETISAVGTAIQSSMDATAGKVFTMGVSLGMSSPNFSDISRSLTVLLSNSAMTQFEPNRNGLGLNNILYISMLMTFFSRRVSEGKTAGQLLILEEPEAHLHPQLQRILYESLLKQQAQSIVTTHSTHITSQAPLDSMLVLSNDGTVQTKSSVPTSAKLFSEKDVRDLERYLDATRSSLLFARKVILAEGPAELFLIAPLVRSVMGIDLDEQGISVIPIHGTHFEPYLKLFGPVAINKKCAVITDGDAQNEVDEPDLHPDDVDDVDGTTEEVVQDVPTPTRLEKLESAQNDYLKVFIGATTFEMELTNIGTLDMFAAACAEVGAPRIAKFLAKLSSDIGPTGPMSQEQAIRLDRAKVYVLNTSKRFQKGRFAQLVSTHAEKAKTLPKYLLEAVEWVIA